MGERGEQNWNTLWTCLEFSTQQNPKIYRDIFIHLDTTETKTKTTSAAAAKTYSFCQQ